MMVQFKKKNNVIPVDFEDFQLEFVANDESLKSFQTIVNRFQENAEKYTKTQDGQVLEVLHEDLTEAWDGVFGDGTFEKVYAFAGGSTLVALNYFLETFFGIVEEYKRQMNATNDVMAKYLR